MHTTAYQDHIATLCMRMDRALERSGHDHALIAAGVQKMRFLDDMPYAFAVNPQFKAWAPLTQHPDCWIAYTPGRTPVLVYVQPDDYWHLPPAPPAGYWTHSLDVRVARTPEEAVRHFPTAGRLAILGEADAALPGFVPNNPQPLLDYLHYHRAYKTPYEIAMLKVAQRQAVVGHRAAEACFRDGGSELDIHRAYLVASGQTDLDLPYGNIVGLNEHGATLHYQHQQPKPPERSRSLLIDAGAAHAGYAADITRTWHAGDARFAALVAGVDREQQALAAQVRPGMDYRELHLQAHLRLAGVLREVGVVDMAADTMVATGVSAAFFPHGLGHMLGLQVHDIGGFMESDAGGTLPKPEGHPFLRLTRTLEPGMVVTIEPGLYFIDLLLEKLRAGPHANAVDWAVVEHLRGFGGVRIEDDVHCTHGEPENLTRDAFAAAH
ncbi:MAG: Xaa-Pro dipeptidase [Proteobacteria bacterium]|nr:Xaa-Pro dipeptidase [Pseudomonadota bacterium]